MALLGVDDRQDGIQHRYNTNNDSIMMIIIIIIIIISSSSSSSSSSNSIDNVYIAIIINEVVGSQSAWFTDVDATVSRVGEASIPTRSQGCARRLPRMRWPRLQRSATKITGP